MDIGELLARLDNEHEGSFPQSLVTEVIARREEVTPRLVRILEDIDRDPEPWLADAAGMLHIWAFYLLALFRETRAYPLLVRIFSRPGEFAFELAGDVPRQDLGRMLASVRRCQHSRSTCRGFGVSIFSRHLPVHGRCIRLSGSTS